MESREGIEFPSGFTPGQAEIMHEGQDLRKQRVGRLVCVQLENGGVGAKGFLNV